MNPQGTASARPASNRFPSPIGWPFRLHHRRRSYSVPQPGFEPGTPRSKRGMISVSPSRPKETTSPAEGEGFEPSSPVKGKHVSNVPRPTVSGYLPTPASGREIRVEKVESRPSKSSLLSTLSHPLSLCGKAAVDSPGVEPGLPPYQSGMLPEHLQTQSLCSLHPVSEVGVEPTKSPGSRPGRFSICVLGRARLGGRESRREKAESGQETAAFLLLYFPRSNLSAAQPHCVGQELNLQCPWGRVGYSHLGTPMPSRRVHS